MNPADILLIALLAAAVIAAITFLIRRRGRGCGGCCEGCAMDCANRKKPCSRTPAASAAGVFIWLTFNNYLQVQKLKLD